MEVCGLEKEVRIGKFPSTKTHPSLLTASSIFAHGQRPFIGLLFSSQQKLLGHPPPCHAEPLKSTATAAGQTS